MLFLSLLCLIFIKYVLADNSSPGLPEQRVIAIRSQRDVSANVTIDQVSLNGVSLSKTLFDRIGYINDSLVEVKELLNIGIQTLVIDAYWNENSQEFQLCPVDLLNNSTASSVSASVLYHEKDQTSYKCDNILSLQGLIKLISVFGTATDTNLSANLIALIFNLHSLSSRSSYFSQGNGTSNNTLSSILGTYLGNKLYTPIDLSSDRSNNHTLLSNEGPGKGFPSLSYFLFNEKKRYVATIWENHLPSNSTYDLTNDTNTLFTKDTLNSSFTAIQNTTTLTSVDVFVNTSSKSWRFAYDDSSDSFDNETAKKAIDQGYSPILNTPVSETLDIASTFNASIWSWKISEPVTPEQARIRSIDDGNTRNTESAYRCGAMTQDGWIVTNCYQYKYVLCRKGSRAFEWVLSSDTTMYFHAEDACPDGSTFSVPRDALQQTYLLNYLAKLGSSYSVWVDMNSISVSDCWVTGGPYASCPYHKVSNNRNFVEMFSPASAFCVVIFIAIILLRLKRVPVQDNKKHWKKKLAAFTENEYEGVPS